MRAVWSGSLNFGLVTIPIKLYSAVEDHDVPLHQVHAADGGRIHYQRICEICGNVVEFRDIDKAYEAPDGRMVVLSDDDFASLPADRSKEISVEQFAPAEQIDALLFDRAYFMEPTAQAAKAYVLLRKTLQRTDRVAVVRFALRQRTQLGALRVHDDLLAVQTLRWPDEVRTFELPSKVTSASVSPRELEMAATLVDSYAEDFDPEQYTDEYRDELEQLIDAKLDGGQDVSEVAPRRERQDAEVVDLMAALERSVARRGGSGVAPKPSTSERKTTAKTAASKKPASKRPASADAAVTKAPAKKGTASKAPASKAPAKKATAKKSGAEKSAEKSSKKKAPASTAPASKTPSKKAPAKAPATRGARERKSA